MSSYERESKVRYEGGHYTIIIPGSYFVRCAVTGVPIPLHELKYWNVEKQQAYASAEVSLQAHLASLSSR